MARMGQTLSVARATQKLNRIFDKLANTVMSGAQAATLDTAFKVAQEAVSRAPLDTGALRKSVYVQSPTNKGRSWNVKVGFSMPYAMAVHERTELRHPIGEAKFLLNAMRAVAPDWVAEVTKGSKRHVKILMGRTRINV